MLALEAYKQQSPTSSICEAGNSASLGHAASVWRLTWTRELPNEEDSGIMSNASREHLPPDGIRLE